MTIIGWKAPMDIKSTSYVCSYCKNPLASNKGWFAYNTSGHPAAYVCICHHCKKASFIDEDGQQYPGVPYGKEIKEISDPQVLALYEEARNAIGVGCYTAAVMVSRKMLMHLAVSKGAKEDSSFAYYVNFLADGHFVPVDALEWVDQVREKGNEANHEIKLMKKQDAQDMCDFIEMLLRLFYEYPATARKRKDPGNAST